jgi:uncharacterized 2Fe-2S/4Fe-4S cluster protein (DUF4445 family)
VSADAETQVTVTFLPEGRSTVAPSARTLLQVARRAGAHIDAPCGDRGRCGKCRVRILAGAVSAVTPEERALLSPAELAAGVRLACEAHALGSLTVEVPESSRNLTGRKAGAELPHPIIPDPFTSKICITDPTVVTNFYAGDMLLGVEVGDTTAAHYGVALDIGTTTVVCYLMNLCTGAEVAVGVLSNPQATYGADVISRISYTQGNPEHVTTLQHAVIAAVNEILATVTKSAGIAPTDILEMTVAGNTCMIHLFLGIDPASLGHAPYTPTVTESVTINAADLGVHLHPRGVVRTLPNIAGFVGADTVAMLAASELASRKGLWIAADIGTNAEILLALDGCLLACSTAAGPAFEGAKIRHGMRALPGAIDGVVIGADLFVHTIDDRQPLGICGSGIIDAVSELVHVGMLAPTGRFVAADDLPDLPDALRARVVPTGVVLVWAAESGTGHDILLTQKDVREVQLVKGAIAAGVRTMLEKVGKTTADLDGFCVAGAFGTYITKEHAIRIGLLPDLAPEKLHFLGNAAGTGAKMALLSRTEYSTMVEAARQVEYVELAGDRNFADHFMCAMTLAPHCDE